MKTIVLSGLIAIACCTATGCISSNATFMSNGKRGYSISCGGMMTTWTKCLVKAGRLCGQQGYVMAYSDAINREALIECKD